MSSGQADPAAVKADIRDSWNAISKGWLSIHELFERGGAAMNERLIELGGVREGQAVLDVATGHGEPLLSAARVVGPSGRVVGTDISPEMISVAEQRAAGLGNVEFLVADFETLDLPPASFDVVLSRWGLMFATDYAAALRNLARLLKADGVLVSATWAAPHRTPMQATGYNVMAERLGLPPLTPTDTGPYGMTDPDKVTEQLTTAGFRDVTVTEFVVPFRLESPQEYVEFNRAVSPPGLRNLISERLGAAGEDELWASVATAVEPHRSDDGSVSLPSVALCARGRAAGAG